MSEQNTVARSSHSTLPSPQYFGLATLLLVTTSIKTACISLAPSHVPEYQTFQHFFIWCSIFHWQKARNNARPSDTAELRWKATF